MAVKKAGLKFGLYHSLFEWFNPMYLADKSTNFTNQTFVTNKIIPEMKEFVTKYNPSVIWSDGDWEANDTYWKSTEFLAWSVLFYKIYYILYFNVFLGCTMIVQ